MIINPRNQFGRRGSRQSNHSLHNSYIKSRQPVIPKSIGDAKLQIGEVLASIKDATEACFSRNLLYWDPIDTSSSLQLYEPVMDNMRLLLHHTMEQVTKDKNGTKTTVMETKDALTEKYGVHIPFPPFNPVRGEYKISRAYRDLGV
eukprot:scaffold67238_cov23-Cyclotella_meneghiniana.AAC.1